jgi:hypothetical protein
MRTGEYMGTTGGSGEEYVWVGTLATLPNPFGDIEW